MVKDLQRCHDGRPTILSGGDSIFRKSSEVIAALSSRCAELEAQVARVEELRDHLLKLPDGHEDFCNNIGESVAAALSGPAQVEKKG